MCWVMSIAQGSEDHHLIENWLLYFRSNFSKRQQHWKVWLKEALSWKDYQSRTLLKWVEWENLGSHWHFCHFQYLLSCSNATHSVHSLCIMCSQSVINAKCHQQHPWGLLHNHHFIMERRICGSVNKQKTLDKKKISKCWLLCLRWG